MAELDITDVVRGIQQLFQHHQFAFWYDPKRGFEDNIDEITEQLGSPVIVMGEREQFKTKLRLIEIEKSGSKDNVLIYSPAAKPALAENFLTDMLEYSTEYTADAAVMLRKSLGLPDSDQQFVTDQRKFFGNKERTEKFKSLYQPNNNLKQTVMAVLAKTNEVRLSSIVRAAMASSLDENNAVIDQFEKYGLAGDFWQFVSQAYLDTGESVKKLFAAFYLALAADQMGIEIPGSLSDYQITSPHNAITFIQNTRQLINFEKRYQEVGEQIWSFLNLQRVFNSDKLDRIVSSDVFLEFDRMIIRWINKQLIAGEFDATLNHLSIQKVIKKRKKMYFHNVFDSQYDMLQDALLILDYHAGSEQESLNDQVQSYVKVNYQIDQAYRHFTVNYNERQDAAPETLFEKLKEKIENIYLNDFLAPSINQWATQYTPKAFAAQQLQRNFYSVYLSTAKERTVVIISDAFRFEAAKELENQLANQDVYNVRMDWALSGVPSVTYFGMPSLLPHRELKYDGDKSVTVDGQTVDRKDDRKKFLASVENDSNVTLVKDFLGWNTTERKQFLVNKRVAYMYHNKVDAQGDNPKMENEVFKATREAIEEISRTINYLRNISVSHIIVVSDHGYLYRDSRLDSADKISLPDADYRQKHLRYAISDDQIEQTIGVAHQSIGDILDSDNQEKVYYPTSPNVFMAPGAGQNYVHGGASLQEMVVPVLQISTQSGKSQAENVAIKLMTTNRRITSRDVSLSILQEKPINDLYKAATYMLYFVDKNDQLVSGKIRYVANETATDVNKRIRNVHVTLSDQSFDNHDPYYLIIQNTENGEQQRIEFQMDLIIGGDFGFDI